MENGRFWGGPYTGKSPTCGGEIGRSATPRRCRPIGSDGMQAAESKYIITQQPENPLFDVYRKSPHDRLAKTATYSDFVKWKTLDVVLSKKGKVA